MLLLNKEVVRIWIFSLMMISIGLSACKINTQIEGRTTIGSSPNKELQQPTLTSPVISDGSDLANFNFAGKCPKEATTIRVTIADKDLSLNCLSGNFNGNMNLQDLTEGLYSVTLTPDMGIAKVINFVIDLTDPTPPSSLVVPSWYGSITQSPPLTWTEGSDSISGISHYEVQLIKNSDSSLIQDWIPLQNGGQLSGLNLTHSQLYHFQLRSVDASGRRSTETSSTDFLPDVVGPTISGLKWSEAANSTNSPKFIWGGSDFPSGVSHYEISLSSTAGGQDIMSWTSFSPNQSPIVSPAYTGVFSTGVVYYMNLRGIDNAGNISAISSTSWALPQALSLTANVFDRGPFTSGNANLSETVTSYVYDTNTSRYYIAGYFLGAGGGQPSRKLARLNSDGTFDSSFNIGNGFNGPVHKTLTQDDGKVIVGGSFTEFNGTSANNLIRLNADGSRDSSFNIGTGLNGTVMALALDPISGEKIYVGGSFSSFNGTTANAILRLNTDGSIDSSFTTGSGLSTLFFDTEYVRHVNDFYAYPDGRILVGGRFNTYNGTTDVGMLIRLSADGTLDSGFPVLTSNTPTNADILHIRPYDGTWLLVGGRSLSSYDGASSFYSLLRIRIDNGAKDAGFTFATTTQSYSSAANGSGKVFYLSDSSFSALVRLNANGTSDGAWPTFSMDRPTAFSYARGNIVVQSDGKIVIGGHFSHLYNNSSMTAQSHGRVVRLNTNGTFDSSFSTKSGFDGIVYSIEQQNDSKFIVGGDFDNFGGEKILNLARLNSDLTLDTTFPGVEVNYGFGITSIKTLGIQSDGKLIIGGEFTSINNSVENKLSRINTDGSVDYTFSRSISGGDIQSLVVQSDDKVVIGGDFTHYDGNPAGSIAQLNPDGTANTSFNIGGSGFNNEVRKIVRQSDNKLLVWGPFTTFNGQAVGNLVRLNTDGTLDTGFSLEAPNAMPLKYASDTNQILAAVGSNFYVLDENGELDDNFTPPTLPSMILAAEKLTDGRYIVSTLTSSDGKSVFKVNANGSIDHSFFVPIKGTQTSNAMVNVIIPLSTSEYGLGGHFKYFNNDSSVVNSFIRTAAPAP